MRPALSGSGLGQPWVIAVVVLVIIGLIFVLVCGYYCCCKGGRSGNNGKAKKDNRERPSIIHTTQPPPYHHQGIENKGVDTLKDADEMIKNTFGANPYEQQSASNSNSANGGSVNSQDSLWNVKGAPHHPQVDPMMIPNSYPGGYNVYDAMAMQQAQQQQQYQQQQQQLLQQQQQQYPEDYAHYPHPEEYLNERNQQFLNGGEFYHHQGGHPQECKFD